MKRALCAMLAIAAGALLAGNSINSIKVPAGKNLLGNPDFQAANATSIKTWGNFGGKQIQVSWKEVEKRKVVCLKTTTAGYHMGINQGVKNLKPGNYRVFIVARGKITGKDSKVQPLYHEVKSVKPNKIVSGGSWKMMGKDFDWTLFYKDFTVPATLKDNNFLNLYAVLLFGTVEVEIAQAGVVELPAK